jgi:tRNA (cmo5U34)-methyltransferase
MKSGRDKVFEGTAARASDFVFNEKVAAVFDDMLVRSVPYYLEIQAMITEMTKRFYQPKTDVIDLGCSTATTLINLRNSLGEGSKLVGYDNSEPMISKAKEKIAEHGFSDSIDVRYGDINGSLALKNSSVTIMTWTLQFVRPLKRDEIIKSIYDGLVPGGVFICVEKILTNSSDMNRFFIDFYYDFKRRNGYSEEEIVRKREALENVLIPYRIEENAELFRRNGFETVETFFQWYNFAGFLCVKSAKR